MADLCPDRLLSKNHCRSRLVAQAIGKAIDPAARSAPKVKVELLSQKDLSQSTRSEYTTPHCNLRPYWAMPVRYNNPRKSAETRMQARMY
jgi:hypothetical protein